MNLDVAIVMTAGGIIGSILVTQLWQMNWIKRENFKLQKSNILNENRIKYKKLEKELGIQAGKMAAPQPTTPLDWIDKLKGINPETLHSLIDTISGEGGESGEGGAPEGIEGIIANIAQNNPELIEKFLGGLKGGAQEENLQQVR
jgi:hypothetical protein